MRRFIDYLRTLSLLLCCSIMFTTCTTENAVNDPEAIKPFIGTWEGKLQGSGGYWRVTFYENMTARLTNYLYDAYGQIMVRMDFTSNWDLTDGEFFIADYYYGHMVSDNKIQMNTRLAEPFTYVTLRKITDNKNDIYLIIDKQNAVKKLIGSWEGIDNNKEYARLLVLQDRHGFTSALEARYYPEVLTLPTSAAWDIQGTTITLRGTAVIPGQESVEYSEQGRLVDDNTIELPNITLKRKNPDPVINDTQVIEAAVGRWVNDNGDWYQFNADMTVVWRIGGVKTDGYTWGTSDDEVVIHLWDEDYPFKQRFVFMDDELVQFPCLEGSPRFHKAAEE